MRALLFILIAFGAEAQDPVTIRHEAYSSTFDKIKCYPVKVEWWITKNSLICYKLIPDPSILKETNLQKLMD